MALRIGKTTSKLLVGGLVTAQALLASLAYSPSALAACSTTTSPATTYGQVTQSVSVASTGTYRVWSRLKAPDTTNNSYYLQIDGGCAYDVGDSGSIPANQWKWIDYQNGNTGSAIDVSLTAGAHKLTYTGKEANVELDLVLLLSDQSCTPVDMSGNPCANPDNTNPTISLTTPSGGDSVTAGTAVTISASASDDTGVTKVEFYNGSTLLGTDNSKPYSYSWDTTSQSAGTKTLTAKAYDAAGNVGTSAAVSISVAAKSGGGGGGGTPGDANGDGHVNGIDFSVLSEHDGQNYPAADFNHDGTVGAADLAILLAKWTW